MKMKKIAKKKCLRLLPHQRPCYECKAKRCDFRRMFFVDEASKITDKDWKAFALGNKVPTIIPNCIKEGIDGQRKRKH